MRKCKNASHTCYCICRCGRIARMSRWMNLWTGILKWRYGCYAQCPTLPAAPIKPPVHRGRFGRETGPSLTCSLVPLTSPAVQSLRRVPRLLQERHGRVVASGNQRLLCEYPEVRWTVDRESNTLTLLHLHQNLLERLLGIGMNLCYFCQPFGQDMNEPASFVHGTVGGKCLGSDLLENPPYMPRKETAQRVHLIINGCNHTLPCKSPMMPMVRVCVCACNSVNTSTFPHHFYHQRWNPCIWGWTIKHCAWTASSFSVMELRWDTTMCTTSTAGLTPSPPTSKCSSCHCQNPGIMHVCYVYVNKHECMYIYRYIDIYISIDIYILWN